jgi:hypothetical protein
MSLIGAALTAMAEPAPREPLARTSVVAVAVT